MKSDKRRLPRAFAAIGFRLSRDPRANVITGAGVQLLSAVVFGLLTIVIARSTSTGEFGELAAAMMIAAVGENLLDFGRSAALLQVQARDEAPTHGPGLRLLRSKAAFSPLILGGLLLLSILLTGAVTAHIVLFWLWIVPYTTWQTLAVPIRSRGELALVSSLSLLERVSALAILFVTQPVLGPSAMPVALALGAAIVCGVLRRPAWTREDEPSPPIDLLGRGRPLAVVALAANSRQLDVPLIAAVAGSHTAGLFAAASRLIGPLGLVISQVGSLVFARASAHSNPLTAAQTVRLCVAVGAFYVSGGAVLWLTADTAFAWLLGEDFQASATVFRALLLGTVLTVISTPWIAWRQAHRQSSLAMVAMVIGTIAYFGTVIFGSLSDSLVMIGLGFVSMQIGIVVVLGGSALRHRAMHQDRRDMRPG